MFKRIGLGFAAGYIVGARKGEKNYERLVDATQKIRELPAVKKLSDQGLDSLRDRAEELMERIRSSFQGDEEGEPEGEYDEEGEPEGEYDEEGEPEGEYDEEGEPEGEHDEEDEPRGGGRQGAQRTHRTRRDGQTPRREGSNGRRSPQRTVAKVASTMLERGKVP